jgi:NADH:ubiquinone oxidoreductase subunit H
VELRRTPFDYVESESELVGGVVTEYRSVGFVLLFLKEYGSLLFFSVLVSTIFIGGLFLGTVIIFFSLIVVRRRFPRIRYDKLMGLMWLELFFHISLALYSTYYILIL